MTATWDGIEIEWHYQPPAGSAGLDQVAGEISTATWGGTEIEWDYQPPDGQRVGLDQIAAALLAHLAVLDGSHDRKEDPR